jgi:hypothetical protein
MTDIWIGLADAVPLEPRDDDVGGAYVYVLAPADDLGELRAAAAEALIELGFRLAELSDAESVRERLRAGWFAPELLELAIDAALERATRLGEFHAYPLVDGEEPDEQANLQALVESGLLVNVRGPGEQHDTVGYVVGVGANWALLQLIDSHGVSDGFRALRLGTVSEVEPVDPEESLLPRVIAARPVTLEVPDVSLDDARALLEGVRRHFALIYLVTDDLEGGAFWIGEIASLDDGGVMLRKVSATGEWADQAYYRYESITRIGFGGGYEEALALAAGTVSG